MPIPVQIQAKKSHGDHKNRSEKDKQKKKKLPVQPADLGKSALVQMVEKLQADMATMQNKYAQLEKRSSSDAHTSTINNVLIPKPKGEVGRSGKNGRKQGYNLQISMGLKGKKVLYNKVRDFVRHQAQTFEMTQGTIKEQEMESLGAICRRAKKKFKWLTQYQRDWPVIDMIRQYLQSRGYLNRRKAKEGKNRRRGDESEDDDSSEDDTFDPQAALYGNDSDNDADMEENSDDEAGSEDITRADKENRPVGPDIALPDKPTGNANHLLDADEHRCAVFLDQDGFFLDPNDTVLEATYNPKTKLYKMPDGRPLELDAMPESLENYENGFNDGISRMRNASGYWQVGSVIIAREPSLSLPMLQKSVATRKTSKYITNTSHTPTAIAPTAKHASIPNSSTSTSMKIQHDPTTPKSCGQGPAAIVLVPCSPLTDISEVSQFSWEDKKSSTKKTTTKPNAKLSKKVIPAAPPKSTNPGSKTSGPKALLSNPHLKRKRDSEDNELSDRPSRATRSTQTSRDPQPSTQSTKPKTLTQSKKSKKSSILE